MQGTKLSLSAAEAIYLMRLLQETNPRTTKVRPASLNPWSAMFHVELMQSLELYVEGVTPHGAAHQAVRAIRTTGEADGLGPELQQRSGG